MERAATADRYGEKNENATARAMPRMRDNPVALSIDRVDPTRTERSLTEAGFVLDHYTYIARISTFEM